MHHVKTHVGRTRNAHRRVEIGSVIIAKAARLMNYLRDLDNIRVKKSDSVRPIENFG